MPNITTPHKDDLVYHPEDVYICLTHLLEEGTQEACIQAWMGTPGTIAFLGLWESVHNPHFKQDALENVVKHTLLDKVPPTLEAWIEKTRAIGIVVATEPPHNIYAHPDIALALCMWLDPLWQLLVLKNGSSSKAFDSPDDAWSVTDYLRKVHCTPQEEDPPMVVLVDKVPQEAASLAALQEADVPYYAMFGITPAAWAANHPTWVARGWHMRDAMRLEPLIVLGDVAKRHCAMLHAGMTDVKERLTLLHDMAVSQCKALENRALWANPATQKFRASAKQEDDFDKYLEALLHLPPM